jgi:hypothetical protein
MRRPPELLGTLADSHNSIMQPASRVVCKRFGFRRMARSNLDDRFTGFL